jgi:hypothetical protein
VRPYLEKSLHKKRAGGVAQGEGQEFNPQYRKTNKTSPNPKTKQSYARGPGFNSQHPPTKRSYYKEKMEGVNSSMIYLIYCKNVCKCHNVPLPSTIKKKIICANYKNWKIANKCQKKKTTKYWTLLESKCPWGKCWCVMEAPGGHTPRPSWAETGKLQC